MTATLQLFDNDIPPVGSGEYVITLAQTAGQVAATIPSATQSITFTAPQVTLDASEVLQCTPAPSSTGPYGEVLPSVLLAEPALPWERTMPAPGCPWLALVIFEPGELTGGDPATASTTATIADFRGITNSVVPQITLDADVPSDQPCTYIQVPTAAFTAVMPRATELPWLAHVRRSTPDGETPTPVDCAVILANRFPSVPLTGATAPAGAVAHLVSVEGLTPWLVDDPVFTASGTKDGTPVLDSVVVLSLARWTFGVVPDPAGSFQGLTLDLAGSEYDSVAETHAPSNLALKLPLPVGYPTDASDPGQAQVASRVGAGYAPVTYHSRSGEETMAWYRGPVTPGLVAALDPADAVFPTADAALIYDEPHGVFDVSLTSAWQIGRAAALADRGFGQALYTYRQSVQRLGDTVVDRAARAHFASEPTADLDRLTGPALGAIGSVLAVDIGADPQPRTAGLDTDRSTRTHVAPVGEELRHALRDPLVGAAVDDLTAAELVPVADWLAGLVLLTPVPFNCLVPDPRMLPRATPAAGAPSALLSGSIRFGYLDPNWTTALLSGALSLAVESSRQAGTAGALDPTIVAAIGDALARRCDLKAPPAGPTSVLMLRSDLVSGWPTLTVTPLDSGGAELPVLRTDRLAPGVLLVMFAGIPASVRIAEPHHALTLGVDEQGAVELRNFTAPVNSGDPPIGAPLNVTTPILTTPSCLRPGSRVLSITATGGLVDTLTAALSAQGQTPAAFGAAALGLLLVQSPQAITFDSAGGS